jgi:predicted transcriptional regulator of viral defense system
LQLTKPTRSLGRLVEFVAAKGVVRPRDVEEQGYPREYLLRLLRRGSVERIGRGLYRVAGEAVSEHHSLAVVGRRSPEGVVCLLSALRFHGLTTQEPHEVWLAIGNKARRPKLSWPPTRVVRMSGASLREGIMEHPVEGVPVRVFGAAKTVADCFKFRNKIGVDVAIEALRDAVRERKATRDEIYGFAKICRVAKVMQPYLEATS